jgi:hypothetical protein
MPLRKIWWQIKRIWWYARAMGPIEYMKKRYSAKRIGEARQAKSGVFPELNLEVGEWVEVRSEGEIFRTLDCDGKLRGMRFTAEMRQYCGKRFRVYKKVRKIIVEATGEKRSMQAATVLLEGVICDGSAHEGCDRACFPFWREQWLKRLA